MCQNRSIRVRRGRSPRPRRTGRPVFSPGEQIDRGVHQAGNGRKDGSNRRRTNHASALSGMPDLRHRTGAHPHQAKARPQARQHLKVRQTSETESEEPATRGRRARIGRAYPVAAAVHHRDRPCPCEFAASRCTDIGSTMHEPLGSSFWARPPTATSALACR